MPNGTRPFALDQGKKREILAILSMGCSRRAAAKYVGCSPTTIANTAHRDPEFAAQVERAESKAEIGYMKNIQKAAGKEQYWRAAAWALERKYPDQYALRSPDAITRDEVVVLLTQLVDLIMQEVPVARFRKPLLKRLQSLLAAVERGRKGWTAKEENHG
jgi:hypothetical protein